MNPIVSMLTHSSVTMKSVFISVYSDPEPLAVSANTTQLYEW